MRREGEAGSATVEVAVALPALALVTVLAVWGVTVAAAQVACADAVRAGARAAARGEPEPAVRAMVAQSVPADARIEIRRDRQLTRVAVSVPVRAPVFADVPAVVVRAQASAATEPGGAVARPLPDR